jgi:hypothetical protein
LFSGSVVQALGFVPQFNLPGCGLPAEDLELLAERLKLLAEQFDFLAERLKLLG